MATMPTPMAMTRRASTGADVGNVQQVRFTPDTTGIWQYRARLDKGSGIATSLEPDAGEGVDLDGSSGSVEVLPCDKSTPDFRAPERGQLGADDGYFHFVDSGVRWLEGGTSSPEYDARHLRRWQGRLAVS